MWSERVNINRRESAEGWEMGSRKSQCKGPVAEGAWHTKELNDSETGAQRVRQNVVK